MKKTTILITILLVVAMVGALALVSQKQETRRGAAFANTTLSVLPNEKITKAVGDDLTAQVWFQTDGDAKVDGVQALVCYGDELTISETDGAVANTEAGFDSDPIIKIKEETDNDNQHCVTVVATSKKSASSLTTTAKALTLTFSAVKAGSGNITINKEKSMVTGDNTASATDKIITITSVAGTTYEITGETVTGDEPILNYEVSFGYVKAVSGKCVVNWPMQIIVLSNGESKVYTGIKAINPTVSGDQIIYKGSLPLVGFSHLNNVAVFIKGPKHLQMKYAIQNQSGPYDKAGGELVLTKDAATSTVYNFSAYPMIPGDVVGPNSETPDGWIDGVDFAFVKNKVQTEHKEPVADGTYLKADLDGDCQYNTNDVNVLQISLQTKQGQLY